MWNVPNNKIINLKYEEVLRILIMKDFEVFNRILLKKGQYLKM